MNLQICVRQRNSGDNWKSRGGGESKREGSKKKLTQLFLIF